ncbi:YiiX/YebB-like N1pC/P60 family cysteine hydrolase [Notoacmeibacter marinus]|uniref:YiiX/YebB-like N1pC/P60 family cysteine hydrolase n=1 Tax=Notoacmeibacter marinus TaxID=1876515 RepID=UPI0013B053A9|nr:YiiX/YebB-like N1pC/P60 family cysteine hydrolase [Notoacmeibacter marinus]
MDTRGIALALSLLAAVPAFGDEVLGDEVLVDWKRGDLIFQETTGPEAEALKAATGSRLTHVGILRTSGGGPIVIEATPEGGVFELSAEAFVARGVGGNYAIYRIKGVVPPPDWYHPLVLAVQDLFLQPYDPYYRADTKAIYGAELVHDGALAIGVELGSPRPLGELGFDTPEGQAFFLAQWQDHPECRASDLDKMACWELMKDQLVVTPTDIAEDGDLELIVSMFDDTP